MSRELLGEFTALRQREGSILAWVTFDGTATPTIKDGFNASSISDNAVGKWTVTWSQAIASSTDYAVMAIARREEDGNTAIAGVSVQTGTYLSTTSVSVSANQMGTDALIDVNHCCVVAVGVA